MKCLNCGKENEHLLCNDCRTVDILEKIYRDVSYYRDETCDNQFVRELVAGLTNPKEELKYVPEILGLFDYSVVEYYFAQYYKLTKDPRYEEAALSYLKSHPLTERNAQKILYGLIGWYLPDDFEKPQKWCEKIRSTDGLPFDLYVVAEGYYSKIGDYDIADELIRKASKIDVSTPFENTLFFSPDQATERVEKMRVENERWRKTPYWPKTETRRQALIPYYDARGIKYPRTKPTKVAEDEFEPIMEADEIPNSYCAFWCDELFSVSTARDIYRIGAVKVRDGKVSKRFESLVKPWNVGVDRAAKQTGLKAETLKAADDVDLVIEKFFSFVGKDVLVSTEALGSQGKLLIRAARYSGRKSIPNAFFDVLDYAEDMSSTFSGKNNTREYILQKMNLREGMSAVSCAERNVQIINYLKKLKG